jgi:crotonobetainyl-CoA:carnitine CoA-transferase CaiB-like acyl-CoA transferase
VPPQNGLPLAGIRVIELGSTVAAPAAGRLMADFGALVIKVEPPDGDHLRRWGVLSPDGTSWWFKSHNRNKKFVSLDLRTPGDAETARRIALHCDVVLENFRPGKLAEYGLGYEQLRAERPDLVYVSISGYGQDGPYAPRPGFGSIAESMSGLRYTTGYPDRPPVRMGISIGDEIAALYATIGALMALRARDATGIGEHVDVSLVESCFSLMEGTLPEYVHGGIVAERMGNQYPRAAPSGTYRTSDERWIAIGANGEGIFPRFARAIGRPELIDDPRYATNQARVQHADELDEIIAGWAHRHTLDEIDAFMAKAGVPAGPVMSIADIVRDPHVIARGSATTVTADDGAAVATYGLIPRLRERGGRLESAAGEVGRDQAEVLELFGLTCT